MNKLYFASLALTFYLTGCAYDPPLKGTKIFIENQTHHFIYVLDSLPKQNLISVYNHYYVNDKNYVAARRGLLAPFTNVFFFYSDNRYKRSFQEDSLLTFYIFQKPDINKIPDSIWNTSSFRIFKVSSVRVHDNSINRIFVYDDSISYTNKYSLRFTDEKR